MKQLIMFDFDRTLIDTDLLKQEQYKRVAVLAGKEARDIEFAMKSYISSIDNHLDFSLSEFANFLYSSFGIDPGAVIKVYINCASYIRRFIYPEIYLTLAILVNHGMQLGIFSEAEPEYQTQKIYASGVMDYIDPTFLRVYKRKLRLKNLKELPDNTYIIDDGRHIVEKIEESSLNLQPIWCNRKTDDVHPKITTIHTLDELVPLVIQSEK